MHLIETYANSVGVKLDKENPTTVKTSFFPVPEKYITIHASSGFPSKNYPFYPEVILYILETLKVHDISIVQIGGAEDGLVNKNVIDLRGKTTFSQASFVVKNSLCHVGNDSVWSHVANSFRTPLVALFGSTIPKVSGPYFKGYNEVLEGKKDGCKPVLALQDPTRLIRTINPEEVANKILKLTNIQNHNLNFDTVKMGENFDSPLIEVVPDKFTELNLPKSIFISIRLDLAQSLGVNIDFLVYLLSNYKCNVILKSPINVEILKNFSKNISEIFYETNDPNIDFVKDCHKVSNLTIVSSLEDVDFNKLKLQVFEYANVIKKTKSNIDHKEHLRSAKYIKNNGAILSDGKRYATEWHLINKIEAQENNYSKLGFIDMPQTDDESFWRYLEFLHLVK